MVAFTKQQISVLRVRLSASVDWGDKFGSPCYPIITDEPGGLFYAGQAQSIADANAMLARKPYPFTKAKLTEVPGLRKFYYAAQRG